MPIVSKSKDPREAIRFGKPHPPVSNDAVEILGEDVALIDLCSNDVDCACVGENGAGKTTIVKLLSRLYDPSEGRITIDGVDIRDFDLGALRACIAVILQDFVRYGFTASENIGVRSVAHLDEHGRVVDAAVRALTDRVIDRLPLGYQRRTVGTSNATALLTRSAARIYDSLVDAGYDVPRRVTGSSSS